MEKMFPLNWTSKKEQYHGRYPEDLRKVPHSVGGYLEQRR